MQVLSALLTALFLPALLLLPALGVSCRLRDREGGVLSLPLALGLGWAATSVCAALAAFVFLWLLPAYCLPLLCLLLAAGAFCHVVRQRRALADYFSGLGTADKVLGVSLLLFMAAGTFACAAGALPVGRGPLLSLHLMASGLAEAGFSGGMQGFLQSLHTGAVNYDFINQEAVGGPLYAGIVSLAVFLQAVLPAGAGSLLGAYGFCSAGLAGVLWGSLLLKRSVGGGASFAVLLAPTIFLALPQSVLFVSSALGAVCLWGVCAGRFSQAFKFPAGLCCLVYLAFCGPAGLVTLVLCVAALLGAWAFNSRKSWSGGIVSLALAVSLCLAAAIGVLSLLAGTGPGRDAPISHYAIHPVAGNFRFMYSSAEEMRRRVLAANLAGDSLSPSFILGNGEVGRQLRAHPLQALRLLAGTAVFSAGQSAAVFTGGSRQAVMLLLLLASGGLFVVAWRVPCAALGLFFAAGTLPLAQSGYEPAVIFLLAGTAFAAWVITCSARPLGRGQVVSLTALAVFVLGLDCAAQMQTLAREYVAVAVPLEKALRGQNAESVLSVNPEAAKIFFPGASYGSSVASGYSSLMAGETAARLAIFSGPDKPSLLAGYYALGAGEARVFRRIVTCWKEYASVPGLAPLRFIQAGEYMEVQAAGKGDIPGVTVTYGPDCAAHGAARVLYENGAPLFTLSIRNGKPEGEAFYYRKNGIISLSEVYGSGRLDGEVLAFREDRTVWLHAFYRAGLLNGQFSSFHPNGMLRLTVGNLDGLPEGAGQTYCQDGSRLAAVNFMNGRPHGVAEVNVCGGGRRITAIYAYGSLLSVRPESAAREVEAATLGFYIPGR